MASSKESTKKHNAKIEGKSKIDRTPEMKNEIKSSTEKKELKVDEASKMKTDVEKIETKKVEIKGENIKAEKGKEKKVAKQKEIPKKEVAVANGFSLKISPKQSKYIMRIIRGKSPDVAVVRLEDVISEKRPVPMAGLEVGHKKGKGLAGGKFPKNACKAIIEIVKQAKANAVVAGIENPVINIAKSDGASAPYRKAGRKAKRAHIHIEIRDKTKLIGVKK